MIQQAALTDTGRVEQDWQARQLVQLMLAEDALQFAVAYRLQLASEQGAEGLEVEQMVFRDQGQHGANAVA